MDTDVNRRVRAAGALGHLLLVVVLALGVFVMHTVGHPDEGHGGGAGTPSHVSAAEHVSPSTPHRAAPEPEPSADPPVMAMDMMSLCLAVLVGVSVLAALLRSALARHRGPSARPHTRVAGALRPRPPPRGPDLTLLSVLRL
jgi:hypothetical protein